MSSDQFPLRQRRIQIRFRDMSKLDDYTVLQKLGQGTFGVVQKATSKKSGELVALKQLLNHSAKEGFPITAMREIIILKQLNHKNILKIIDMIHQPPNVSNASDLVTQRGCFYTVSPYMASDLVGLLENPNISIKLPHIKCFMNQLLQGINYIHQQMFLHRDIKAANILIDGHGVLKIADFGLARSYHGSPPKLSGGPGGGERPYTGLVVTRWYRPPELLLGERKYTTAVDMWGVGCVFAELFTHKPILVGKTDAHQAQLVFSLVGTPSEWTHASSLPNKTDFNIGLTCKRSLESRFKSLMPSDGISLLSGLLALDPYKRFNALDALNHDFFKNDPLPLQPNELPKFEESHEIDKERFKKIKENSRHENGYNRNETASNSHDVYIPKSAGPRATPNKSNNGYRRPGEYSRYDSYQKMEMNEYSKRRSRSPREQNQSSGSDQTSYSSLRNRSPKAEASSDKVEISSYSSLRNRSPKQAPVMERERINYSTGANSSSTEQKKENHESKASTTNGNTARQATSNALKPTIKNESKPSTISTVASGIFMKQKRKLQPNEALPSKRTRVNGEDIDSELSDTGRTPNQQEEDKFDKFLDNESFKKESEFRKLSNEKVRFLKGKYR